MRRILLVPLLLAYSHLACAAAAFVQQTDNSLAAGANTISAPAITVTAGDLLVVIVSGAPQGAGQSGVLTLTGGTFTYACAVGANTSLTLASAPSSGATSATLASAWANATGSYAVEFSDNETRWASFTNGSTAISWSNALTATVTTSAVVGNSNTGAIAFYELSAAAGSTTITANESAGTDIQGITVDEYSGVSSYLGCSGGLAAAIAAANSTFATDPFTAASTPALIYGFTQAGAASASTGATAGTGYTLRTATYATWGSYGFPEDDLAPSGTSVSAGWGTSAYTFSTWMSVALAFSGSGGSSCTHDGITSAGALAIPNGTSGTYQGKTGAFVTPDCSTVNYRQPTVGNFGTN